MESDQSISTYLEKLSGKLSTILGRGEKVLENLVALLQRSITDKVALEDIQSEITNNRTLNRRLGTTQAADLVGVTHSLIYTAEQDGRLPSPLMRQDTKKATRAGYTYNDINRMRDIFGTRPSKPPKTLATVAGILNLKGGCQKTTHCQLYAQYLAIRGYRVLVIDTDPQGSLSLLFGKRPDVDVSFEHTIGPYLLETQDFEYPLEDNEIRNLRYLDQLTEDREVEDEEGNSIICRCFKSGANSDLRYAVQKTYWDNIDIIPACLENQNIDVMMPQTLSRESSLSTADKVSRLRNGLYHLREDYDFILIDGTPSLNFSTLNVISACDMVFVPTPAAYADFSSTISFTKQLEDLASGYIEDQQEYSEDERVFPHIPDVHYFIAKYSKSSSATFWSTVIRRVFSLEEGDVLENESYHTDEVGKASTHGCSIYEVSPSETDNRKRLKKDVEMFDSLFTEMHDMAWKYHWEQSPRAHFSEKVDEIIFESERVKEELDAMIREGN